MKTLVYPSPSTGIARREPMDDFEKKNPATKAGLSQEPEHWLQLHGRKRARSLTARGLTREL